MSKLWGIRHVRYFYLKRRLLRWWSTYQGIGACINPHDWAYLDAVWRGEA